MSAFLEGLGKVFGKVADQFQGRIERLRNERESLVKEKKEIEESSYDIENESARKKVQRYTWIVDRIDVIDGLLRNQK